MRRPVPLVDQMKEVGLNALLLGGETMNTAKFPELAGPAAEGHVASTPRAALSSRPKGRTFAQRYRDRCNQEIGLYAPYLYDGVMVIATAMQKVGSTDPAQYLPALRQPSYPGVTADVDFDKDGDLRHAQLSIFRVQCGQWVLQQ